MNWWIHGIVFKILETLLKDIQILLILNFRLLCQYHEIDDCGDDDDDDKGCCIDDDRGENLFGCGQVPIWGAPSITFARINFPISKLSEFHIFVLFCPG